MSHPDGSTAVSSISKAELIAQTFVQNLTLDDLWLIPPSPPPSDYIMPFINITYNDVFHAHSDLDSRKAYSPDGVSPIVFENCFSSCSLPGQTFPSLSVCIYLSFLLEVCSHSTCS